MNGDRRAGRGASGDLGVSAGAAGSARLLIEGEAGIGKSTLWRAGVQEAGERRYRVLACAGAESETQRAFTAVPDLVTDIFEDVAGQAPTPQLDAMEVVLLREEPAWPPPGRGTIAVAFSTILRALDAEAQAVLAIEDAQ